ncbi:hypothetical protein DL766_005197 [Monosporascus sp. MC13-8B]|nr:hypothetical protein DL763_002415 [Monosporascus cannonballus]RYP29832.1 hypothetical protein DL766_005197 [Monosporascus sp. MC13-8B]
MDPIAIVGFSFRLPQEALDERSFWDILQSRRSLMTPWPESRLDLDSFYDGNEHRKPYMFSARGGHFLKGDVAAFDAPFFSITENEAIAMDPQHRLALETSYRALENAGISVESIRGSRTAVFANSFLDDYSTILTKDLDTIPRMAATGIASSIIPNRVSCFDSRANGYARGEGVVCLVIKSLSKAVQEGDMVRAIIRSTGTNQDGRTPSLSQPHPQSQERLIREVYQRAGLCFDATRYVEAHDGNGALQASERTPNLQRANEPELAGEGTGTPTSSGPLKLLVWTAADEKAVQRAVDGYELYLDQEIAGCPTRFNQLAYTLAARRQHMEWRTFAILNISNGDELVSNDIGHPEFSQPLCTALQIALVELLKSLGIEQMAVCGHSSGEIAAAYAVGALSQEAACKVAYYRGQLASRLKATATSPGAMISVGLSKDGVLDYLARLPPPSSNIVNADTVRVACINSPWNCTLSGSEDAIETLREQLERDGIFGQKLNTGVAYHSPAMLEVASEYHKLLGSLDVGQAQYWVDNLISPVRFSEAVLHLMQLSKHGILDAATITDFIEVGPHAALRRPINDTYWAESRFSRDSRLPGSVPASVLGKRSHDWNPLEPRWRHILSPDTVPWLGDHVVSNKVLLPGAGMLIAAIQAATQYMSPSRKIAGFYFKEAHFLQPIVIDDEKGATEMVTHLRPRPPQSPGSEPAWLEVKIFTYANDRWTECFESTLQVRDEKVTGQMDADNEERLERERVTRQYQHAVEDCTTPIDPRSFYNFIHDFSSIRYGQSFQLLRDIEWNGRECSVASIKAARPGLQDKRDLVHPAALDAAVQLAVVSLSKGLARLDATLVPNKLFNTWISTKWLNSSSVKVLSETRLRPGGSRAISTVHVLGDEGSLLCTMERLVLAAVSHHKAPRKDSMLSHGIDWKPQLSLLSPRQLHQWCHANAETRNEASVASYYHNLGSALLSSVRRVLMELSAEDLRTAPAHMQMYIASMEYHISRRPGDSDHDEAHVETLLQRCEEERPAWKLNRHVIRNLRELITGKMNALELFFHENMAEEYYKWVFNQICDVRFRRLLTLLSHENPGIRILEVGAGTGGMTSHVLPVLQEFERQDGSACFSEYTYTDISPAFLDDAKRKFQDCQGRISFHTLDLERDSREQGFAAGSFDVVVAGSVIHATSDLAATLQNIHRLLTPGGHLLYFELTADDDPCLNVPWGLLPGWWMSKEEWRTNSPLISEHRWDQTLRQAGFSGNDVILRDHEDDACHLWSMMISTKVSTADEASKCEPRQDRGIVLVIDPNSREQVALSQLIVDTRKAIAVSLHSLQDIEWKEGETVISLLEIGKPLLATISEACFSDVKSLIQRSCKLLWVTSTSVQDAEYPSYSLAIGFLRTVRSEASEKHIVTISIESADGASSLASWQDYIIRILDATVNGTSPEIEFIVQDGYITTGRLKQRKALHRHIKSLMSPAIRREPWLPGPALVAHVATPDHEGFHFVEDLRYHRNELTPYFVEIEAKSWALNFHDSLTVRRRLQQDDLGFECAGLVTRVGSGCLNFKPGDRVVMVEPGCIRTYPRAHQNLVLRLSDESSFEEAVMTPFPTLTAYYSLVRLAQLQVGEKVLVHSAAESTGQMALWIAKMVGAVIFATVKSKAERDLLVKRFGVPADHILSSQGTSFVKGIRRITGGCGVDVILNSSGETFSASWECLAPFGRFIYIGTSGIGQDTSTPLNMNTSFFVVDMYHVARTNRRLTQSLFKEITDLLSQGHIQKPFPQHVYPASDFEEATSYIQSGHEIDRVVISVDHAHTVPKSLSNYSAWKLDPKASYVVAGGLGGIGRSVARWMAIKGARHLILLSRSGAPSSVAASETISEMETQGVNIATPRCDVSSATMLSKVLHECRKTMPPIKGCVNSIMVLQDSIFDNMSHCQWKTTLKSKVDASWNLHRQLPEAMDFFILLSSLSGIYGNSGQSNYAAGSTYQDALARHRISRGQKAISFDLGLMRTIGRIAEIGQVRRVQESFEDMQVIEEDEFIALLDLHCDPSRQPSPDAQVLVGARTAADFILSGQEPVRRLTRPLFSGFLRPITGGADKTLPMTDQVKDTATLFRRAASVNDKIRIVVEALRAKLARALGVTPKHIDPSRPMIDYGVDSLVAAELRSWSRNNFGSNLTVFDIMGGKSIATIGGIIVENCNNRKEP